MVVLVLLVLLQPMKNKIAITLKDMPHDLYEAVLQRQCEEKKRMIHITTDRHKYSIERTIYTLLREALK